MNAIDRAFWDGALTERLLNGLSANHRRVLALIAFSYNAGVPEHALVRKMGKLSGVSRQQTRKLVHDLFPLSLVGGIHNGENLYFCPSGIAETARKKLIGNIVKVPDSTDRIVLFTPPNLLEDIFSFLAHLYKENIPLTLMGKVRKTILGRIFSGSPTCCEPALHFSSEHRNTFVIAYLKQRELVSFDRREAKITGKLSGWLALTMTERIHDIVSFVLKNKLQDSAVIVTLNGMFSEMPAGTSFDTQDLIQFLHTETTAPGGLKRLETRVRDMLSILYHLGILSFINGRFTVTETGGRFFRDERLPLDENAGKYFTVQPNFDVIVGPELEPGIRFTLELLTSRKSRDTVLTFVITQEGIARARERGMSTEDVMRFFHDHSRNPIPQNVRFSVETWANNYGSIFFENVTLMRFRDSAILSSVTHSPDIAPYVVEQLSDTALVISSKNISTVTAFLKKAGFLPEAFSETVPDKSLSGTKFTPVHVNSVIDEHSLPEVRNNFIFPQSATDKHEKTV